MRMQLKTETVVTFNNEIHVFEDQTIEGNENIFNQIAELVASRTDFSVSFHTMVKEAK